MAKKNNVPENKYQVLDGAPKKVLLPGIGEIELDKITSQQAEKLIEKGCTYVVPATQTEAAAAE